LCGTTFAFVLKWHRSAYVFVRMCLKRE